MTHASCIIVVVPKVRQLESSERLRGFSLMLRAYAIVNGAEIFQIGNRKKEDKAIAGGHEQMLRVCKVYIARSAIGEGLVEQRSYACVPAEANRDRPKLLARSLRLSAG